MKRLLLLILLSTLYVSGSYATDMYKWTDEEGNVQFGQNPPKGAQAELIEPKIPLSSPTKAPSETPPADEVADTTEDEDAETPPTPAEEMQALKKKNCDEALNEKETLTVTDKKLVVEDEKNPGQFVPLSEEQRAQRLQKAEAYLDAFCQEAPSEE